MFQNSVPTTRIISIGLLVGLVGGLAEVAVVSSYEAATGGSVMGVAKGISSAFGLVSAPVSAGLALHMLLAAGLGIVLVAGLRAAPGWARAYRAVPFMLGSLAAVWAINFFLVLPVISPAFVHLLPLAVTLGSKLAFGAAAAIVLNRQAGLSVLLQPVFRAAGHCVTKAA
jgi:hypothetical protein